MGNRPSSLESFDDMQLLQISKRKKFMESIFCLYNFRNFQNHVLPFINSYNIK